MTGKVINFGKETNNGKIMSPRELLEDALEMMDNEEDNEFKIANKMVILVLDDTDGCYNVHWAQAGMLMSQCAMLCEVGKVTFLDELGYIRDK